MAFSLHGCNSLFYYPDDIAYRDVKALPCSCDDVIFSSHDGTRLHGWFLHASTDSPRGTVLYFHGNAQNLTSHVSFVDWLPGRGFNVFIFDYRGYGKSEGSPSRQGIHEDCLAAFEYLRSRGDVDRSRVVVFAQSLGGACGVAALGESDPHGVRAVAVDSSFATYIGMGNEALGGTFLTYPIAWLLLSNQHSPAHSIARTAPVPILFFHSPQDPVVPLRQGRKLFEAAAEPKELIEVSTAGHPTEMNAGVYRERLVAFFESQLGTH